MRATRLAATVGIAVVLIVVLLVESSGTVRATTFNPQFSSPVTFSDTIPGGHPDITTSFDIPPPSALGGGPTFGDPALTTAADAQIATGAYIGTVSTTAKLGILNDGCMTDVPSSFNLVEASTPTTTAVLISGAEGNLAEDDGDLDEDGLVDQPTFADNGIADGADAYPAFLNDLLDPDAGGGLPPIAPSARYFGVDIVFNVAIVIVQVLVLQPGDLAAFPNQSWMTPVWGTPSVIVLGDPTAPPTNNGQITDFCNLSSTSAIFGTTHDNACTPPAGAPASCSATGGGFTVRRAADGGCPGSTIPNECGFIRATNPVTTRTLRTRVYSASERDYDDDGIANSLDVCATTPNATWDPYAFNFFSGQDSDGDGAPDPCDTAPGANSDQDIDGWQNRIDNCPTVPNGFVGGPGGPTPNTGQWDQDVPRDQPVGDGGPHADGIGPECDIAANSCAGCSTLTPTGPNGHYHATVILSNVCIGPPGADSDGDGVCNAQEPPAGECAGGVNDTDCDDDGIGDQLDNCITAANAPPPGFAQSQRDLTANGFSDTADIAPLTSAFGSQGGNPGNDGVGDSGVPGYQGRLDLTYDSFVDTADIALLTSVFGKRC